MRREPRWHAIARPILFVHARGRHEARVRVEAATRHDTVRIAIRRIRHRLP
jgi:hypothetical protein